MLQVPYRPKIHFTWRERHLIYFNGWRPTKDLQLEGISQNLKTFSLKTFAVPRGRRAIQELPKLVQYLSTKHNSINKAVEILDFLVLEFFIIGLKLEIQGDCFKLNQMILKRLWI